jgi:light-regulated signal transduction histidine kinase (bacteriophytochrome)
VDDLEGFCYSVSHDLRAPLRAIDGFSAILREDYTERLDAEGQRLLQVVSDNAQKMGQLIDDILAFSRAGRRELQIVDLDMRALAAEAWQGLEAQWHGRAIDLRLADLQPCQGDAAALRQVWQNLLGNAVKFTRQRTPARIEVGSRREGAESLYYVRDNGAGFDQAYAGKLFGLFQRLHGMDEFEGTGVGLAIVKRYVVKLGGRVWAEGQADAGACFWFSLPAAADT